MDGGFSANNPSMIAYVDATRAEVKQSDLSIISVGVGQYDESLPLRAFFQGWRLLPAVELMSVQMAASANYIDLMFHLTTRDAPCLRINDEFSGLKTNLLENDTSKLERIFQKGRESFARREDKLRELFGVYVSEPVL